MKISTCGFVFLATVSFLNHSIAAPLSPQRIAIRTSNLEEGVKLIEDEYKNILKAYEKVKNASPLEYTFYCNQLKSVLIKAVEEEKLGFKSKMSQLGYHLFVTTADEIRNSSDPLHKFKTMIAPKHISLLTSNRSGLSESELTKKADTLIAFLKDVRNIIL